jgi:hypothetical protein
MPSECLNNQWMVWLEKPQPLIEFVHVPRTGGFNIRVLSGRPHAEINLKYLGHVPAVDRPRRCVATVIRHPVERVISCYNHFYKNVGRVETIVEMVKSHFIYSKSYVEHWFKHKAPDIVVRFNNYNRDWMLFNTLHNLNLPREMIHTHQVNRRYTPTDDEMDFLNQHYATDVEYYETMISNHDQETLKIC